jgi:hypothetical protein
VSAVNLIKYVISIQSQLKFLTLYKKKNKEKEKEKERKGGILLEFLSHLKGFMKDLSYSPFTFAF